MLKQNIKATNLELTPSITEYLDKRLSAVDKLIDDEIEALARIDVGRTTHHHHKGDVFRAEINLRVGDKNFHAVSETTDLYAAIDEMRDEIVQEVNRSKKKTMTLLKKGHQKIKNMIRRIYPRS